MQACVLRLDEYQFHEVRDINHVAMVACHTCHVYSSADYVIDQSTDCGQDLQRPKTQSCYLYFNHDALNTRSPVEVAPILCSRESDVSHSRIRPALTLEYRLPLETPADTARR
uniref:Uncharacterized protein n=1 Tax=Timema monikensis TaxID=170555 RepID=A0A7R9HSA4_9NEOP|nr:unnamed protein product [Timema monikensis]